MNDFEKRKKLLEEWFEFGDIQQDNFGQYVIYTGLTNNKNDEIIEFDPDIHINLDLENRCSPEEEKRREQAALKLLEELEAEEEIEARGVDYTKLPSALFEPLEDE